MLGLAAAAAVWGQEPARDLSPGQQYESGVRVRDAAHSLSFRIPDTWAGRIPLDSEALLLSSADREGIGIVAVLDGMTPELLVERLSEPQDFGGSVILQLSRSLEQSGLQWRASYLSGSVIGRALAILGPDEHAVVYFFAGPQAEVQAYEQVLSELAVSTTFEAVSTL